MQRLNSPAGAIFVFHFDLLQPSIKHTVIVLIHNDMLD